MGVYYFGLLNDSIGRKKSFFVCLTTLLVGSVFTATAQNFWWWAASRTIVGLTIPAIYQIPFIICKCLKCLDVITIIFYSPRVSRSQLPLLRYSHGVFILHLRFTHVVCNYIFGSRLGSFNNCYITTVRSILLLLVRTTRKSSLVTREGSL